MAKMLTISKSDLLKKAPLVFEFQWVMCLTLYLLDPEVISIDLRGKSNEEVAKITEASLSFKFVGFSLTGDV